MDKLVEEIEKSLRRKLHPWEHRYVEEYGEYCHSASLVATFWSVVVSNIVSRLERELGRKLNPGERAKVRKLIQLGKSFERIKFVFEEKGDPGNRLETDFEM